MIMFEVTLRMTRRVGPLRKMKTDVVKWEVAAYNEDEAIMAATAHELEAWTGGGKCIVGVQLVEAVGVPEGAF